MIYVVLSPKISSVPSLTRDVHQMNKYKAVNPLNDKVQMTIDCGSNWEPVKLTMFPRTTEDLWIKPVLEASVCNLERWEIIK